MPRSGTLAVGERCGDFLRELGCRFSPSLTALPAPRGEAWAGKKGLEYVAARARASLRALSHPTLDLYTAEGEAIPDVIGIRRIRGAGIEIEPLRKRRRRSREHPIETVGSLIEQLTIGVVTVSRRGEVLCFRPTLDLYTTQGEGATGKGRVCDEIVHNKIESLSLRLGICV